MIDTLILIVIAAGVVTGWVKGFIRQLASILGLVVGLLAAKLLYTPLAEKLCPTLTESMTMAQVLAFLIIWIAVPMLFSVVASVLTRAVEVISLGWLNRWLGCGLGALKYMLLVSLVICVIEFIDSGNHLITQTKKSQSVFYYPMKTFAGIFCPAAEKVTQQYILKNNEAEERS